jgi:anti-sigma-K factor RskA
VNTEAYISSGILESYLLGLCSREEALEVEKLMLENQAIREELLAIQEVMEQMATQTAVAPPSALKDSIWESIQEAETPIVQLDPVVPVSQAPKQEAKVVPIRSAMSSWINRAAALVLIAVSSGFAVYFYGKTQQMNEQMTAMSQNQQDMEYRSAIAAKSMADMQHNLAMVTDASTKKISLAGVPTAPGSKAVVFWNEAEKQVMLAAVDLPAAPADKQYQLWALVDGVPVDAGVFDSTSEGEMLAMKSIAKSQAFAITLEPKGGSVSPHLDALYVMGNV